MQDHTHLQLCFRALSTHQTPTSNPSLPPCPTAIISKATSSNKQKSVGKHKACCHHVVEQVAKGTLVDKYAKKVLVCKSSTPFRVILSA